VAVAVAVEVARCGCRGLLADPRAQQAMTNFMANGGQTPEGEGRLGELAGEIN